MKLINALIIIFFYILNNDLYSQRFLPISNEEVYQSQPLYRDIESGDIYTKHIIVGFKNNTVGYIPPKTTYDRNYVLDRVKQEQIIEIEDFLEAIDRDFGLIGIKRYYEYGETNDTLRTNRATKKEVAIYDDTQVFLIQLREYVKLDNLKFGNWCSSL